MAVTSTAYESYVEVALCRPPVNALDPDAMSELASEFDRLASDQRPVLLTGEGGRFSAGFDLRSQVAPEAAAQLAARCLTAVAQHPSPVVAVVEGAAVGLGLLIAASSDIVVFSSSAVLRMPEVTIGSDLDPRPLRSLMAEKWVRRLCLSGLAHTADQLDLQAAGAIVCAPGDARVTAESVMTSLTDNRPRDVRLIKAALNRARP